MKMKWNNGHIVVATDESAELDVFETIKINALDGMTIEIENADDEKHKQYNYYAVTVKDKNGDEIATLFVERDRFYLRTNDEVSEFNKDKSAPTNRIVVYDYKER